MPAPYFPSTLLIETLDSTCIVSIFRLHSLYVISRARDITWENPLAAIWSCVEVNTGILCSCLPTLKAALSRIFPKLFGSVQGSGGSPPGSGSAGSGVSRGSDRRSERHRDGHGRQSTLEKIKYHTSRLPFDAFGRGLSGRSEPMQSSTISGKTDLSSSGEVLEMECADASRRTGEWERERGRRIQVVTTVEQDVEKIGESENGSVRKRSG